MSVVAVPCAACGQTWCPHSDLEFAGIVPARAPRAGDTAQAEVPSPRAPACALSDHRVHADTSTSQEQHNHG